MWFVYYYLFKYYVEQKLNDEIQRMYQQMKNVYFYFIRQTELLHSSNQLRMEMATFLKGWLMIIHMDEESVFISFSCFFKSTPLLVSSILFLTNSEVKVRKMLFLQYQNAQDLQLFHLKKFHLEEIYLIFMSNCTLSLLQRKVLSFLI